MSDERYHSDPMYARMVDAIHEMLKRHEMTPSEVREAAVHACVLYEQYRPARPIVIGGVTYTPKENA